MINCKNVSVYYTRKFHREKSIKDLFISTFAKQRKPQRFCALQNIDLELGKGEIMGIIGANGSGKSTLLKVFGGLLKPDMGTIEVSGRVAPLLELGLGFEPSLTGAENVYLNGSILGMKKEDIKKQFDTIVAFAELGEVIDSPLAHYSTGMMMRLGFAIAAHSPADILLVDEILAVGDLFFQQKCIDRIIEINKRGVSIVFVSHSMNLVRRFCRRALWIDKGNAMSSGDVDRVILDYETNDPQLKKMREDKIAASERKGREVQIKGVDFFNGNMQPATSFNPFDKIVIKLDFLAKIKVDNPIFGLAIHHSEGTHICGPNTQDCLYPINEIEGSGSINLTIPSLRLVPGVYKVSIAIWDSTHTYAYDWEEKAYPFKVENPGGYQHRGYVPLEYHWEIRK